MTACISLVVTVLAAGCATTTSPTGGTEIAAELRRANRSAGDVSRSTRAQQVFVRGLTQAQLGRHDEALDLYTEALRLAPNTAAILSAASDSHAALGDDAAALYSARKACELDPDNIYYHFQLAQLYLSEGETARAAEMYRDLQRRFPDNLQVLYELARVHTMNGAYSEAVAAYERLLEEIGDDRDVQNEILHLYTRMGDVGAMERLLRDMLDAHPHDVHLRKLLSDVYLKQGRNRQAAEQLEEALDRQPGDVEALLGLADLYREFGLADSADAILDRAANLEAASPAQLLSQAAPLYNRAARDEDARHTAVQLLERVLEMNPASSDALVMLGDIRIMQEHYREGGELLYRSLQQNPRDPQVWMQAAGAFLQAGDPKKAAEISDEGLSLFPGSLPLLRISGYALMETYRNREATERFEEAVRIIREDRSEGQVDLSDLYGALGLLYDRQTDHEASDRAYELALEANPENATALNNYAYSLAERNVRLDRALELATRAVALSPDTPSFHDTLGWVYFRRGDFDEALKWIRRAADSEGASAAVHEHLGDAHSALGNAQEARRAWKKALEMNPESRSLQRKLGSQ